MDLFIFNVYMIIFMMIKINLLQNEFGLIYLQNII